MLIYLDKIYKPSLFIQEMKKFFITLLVILIIGIGSFYLLKSDPSVTGNVVAPNPQVNSLDKNVKIFVITGDHLRFFIDGVENPDIKVRQGDKIRIEYKSTEGFHDWRVDEFNAATEKVNPEGGMTSVEFIADKKGMFEYYCSVGQHRANGMKGNFIVE